MKKAIVTAVGVGLVAAGVAGWFLLPDRGEMVVLGLIGLGGFLIDAGTTAAFGKAVVDLVRGVRK